MLDDAEEDGSDDDDDNDDDADDDDVASPLSLTSPRRARGAARDGRVCVTAPRDPAAGRRARRLLPRRWRRPWQAAPSHAFPRLPIPASGMSATGLPGPSHAGSLWSPLVVNGKNKPLVKLNKQKPAWEDPGRTCVSSREAWQTPGRLITCGTLPGTVPSGPLPEPGRPPEGSLADVRKPGRGPEGTTY